ncbi:MAG: hypothetical protein RR334_00880 [Clostridia bacterium]
MKTEIEKPQQTEQVQSVTLTKSDNNKLIAFTFFKSLIAIVCFLFYSLVMMIVVYPTFASGYFETLGLNKASITVAEREYKRTNGMSELYNLISLCVSLEDNAKIETYASAMLSEKNFKDFATIVDKSAVQKSALNAVAYVYSYEDYLTNKIITSKYVQNKKSGAIAFAVNAVLKEVSSALYVPVKLIMFDNSLTSIEKETKMKEFYETKINGKSIFQLIATNSGIFEENIEGQKVATKLYLYNCEMNVQEGLYYYSYTKWQNASDTDKPALKTGYQKIQTNINELQAKYDALLR